MEEYLGMTLRSVTSLGAIIGLLLLLYIRHSDRGTYGDKQVMIWWALFLWCAVAAYGSVESITQHAPVGVRTFLGPLATITTVRTLIVCDLTLTTYGDRREHEREEA